MDGATVNDEPTREHTPRAHGGSGGVASAGSGWAAEMSPAVPVLESLTTPQKERRNRILQVAGQLAAEGGWDAVQMREVAQGAGVALGTLYRYFPSKEYLLGSMMIAEVQALADRLAVRPPQGTDPVDRVIDVLTRATAAVRRRPLATLATIRALVSGNTDIAPVMNETFDLMRQIVSAALEPTGDNRPAAPANTDGKRGSADRRDYTVEIEMLTDIWLAALVAWISGVETEETMLPKLETAARVLFG